MLRGQQGSEWRGTYDLIFNHQANRQDMVKSAGESCIICRSLLVEITKLDENHGDTVISHNSAQSSIVDNGDRSTLTIAYLSEIYKEGYPGIYRLDFKLNGKKPVGTFVLNRVNSQTEDGELGDTLMSSSSGK